MEATITSNQHRRPILTLFFVAAALACGILACIELARLWTHTQKTSVLFVNTAEQKTRDAVASIWKILQQSNTYFDEIAPTLYGRNYDFSEIEEALRNRPSFLSGAFVDGFANVHAMSIELNDSQKYKKIETPEDIAELEHLIDSGDNFISGNKPFILTTEPYTHIPSLMRIAKHGGTTSAISINMNHIDHILRTLYLDQSGYWFLTDEAGNLINHPNHQYALHNQTIFDIAKQTNSPTLATQFEKRTGSKPVFVDYANEITHARSRAFIQKIPQTPLTLVGVFDLNETDIKADFIRQHQLLLWWWLVLCLFFLIIAALSYKSPLTSNSMWYASIAATFILVIAIGASWVTCLTYPYVAPDDTQITSKKQLYQMLQELEKWKQKDPNAPSPSELVNTKQNGDATSNPVDPLSFRYKQGKYIPTGILINDISFEDHEKIQFVGYIWQRYFDGIHDGIERGFIFPQLADKPTISQIHRSKQGNTETIIWQVSTKLNQDFSYERYPFDVANITIAIRHKEFDKNVTLVPDLDAYSIINPTSLPGINKTTHINNWALLKSYFGYDFQQYSTNFGLYLYGPFGTYSRSEQSDVAELRFNVIAQRYLIDTIITDLLALCVIAVILFVLLLTYFSEGFELILETAGAAFFSTVFAQIQFRSKAPTHEFVYFESFYFVLYATIILLLISTLIHLFHLRFKSINYKHNIITKVLYWPCMLMALLCSTIWFLY